MNTERLDELVKETFGGKEKMSQQTFELYLSIYEELQQYE